MELKIVKSRPPDIRLKKNAEVKIHKKEFISRLRKRKHLQQTNLIPLFR